MKKFYIIFSLFFGAIALYSFVSANGKANTAEINFKKYCLQCHGADLQGGNAQSLFDGVWQFGSDKSDIYHNIKFGIQDLGMPSFSNTLSDNEINELIDYINNLEDKQGIKNAVIPLELETIDYKLKVETFVEGLEVPWAIDFIDKETALITERPGRLRIVINGKLNAEAVVGTPKVLNEGQGGLLDVAIDPNYSQNGWIYLAYSHQIENGSGSMTRIVRGKLSGNSWTNEEVIYKADEKSYSNTRHHYGCRIVFDKKGYLFFSIGERGAQEQAQMLDRPNGKIHRIYPDGRIPEDNPFVNKPNIVSSIFTFGNRNPQGLAIHPITGEVWETEHGPMGGDELNLIEAGKNYGWPLITYGKNYDGTIITDKVKQEGMEQPIYYWNPSIAVCGLDFYRGDLFPLWKNKLLVGALKYEEVRLLDIEKHRVMHEEIILKNLGRVRDVTCGLDGAIYVVLNEPDKVLRITPN